MLNLGKVFCKGYYVRLKRDFSVIFANLNSEVDFAKNSQNILFSRAAELNSNLILKAGLVLRSKRGHGFLTLKG